MGKFENDITDLLNRAGQMTGGGQGGMFPAGTPFWNKRYRINLEICGLKLIEGVDRPDVPGTPWVTATIPEPTDWENAWIMPSIIVYG